MGPREKPTACERWRFLLCVGLANFQLVPFAQRIERGKDGFPGTFANVGGCIFRQAGDDFTEPLEIGGRYIFFCFESLVSQRSLIVTI